MSRGAKRTKARVRAEPVRRRRPAKGGASRHRPLGQRLAETLEQQAATSEILRVIRRSPADAQPAFDMIAERAMRLCGALHGGVLRFDGELVHVAAHVDVSPDFADALQRLYPKPPSRTTAAARAILTRATVHIPDIERDLEYEFVEATRAAGFRSALAVPMLRDGQAIGAIVVFGGESAPFSEGQVRLLETFADQAVIAVENVRLFSDLEARNRDLAESLEQKTSTSEILRVISSSPTDVQPVFDAIVASAARLCEADFSAVARLEGGLLHLVAINNMSPAENAAYHSVYPRPARRDFIMGRAFLDGRPVHVEDVLTDPDYDPRTLEVLQRAATYRSYLGIPIIRNGVPIGAIGCGRRQVRPFSPAQIELVTTFADQAVIAIENARLFAEVQRRNSDLGEALERQTATGEILRVISSSPTDVQPVFDTIAQAARRLCDGEFCHVFQFDGERLHFVAHHGLTAEGAEAGRRAFSAPPDQGSAAGRAVLSGAVEHVPDVHADPEYTLEPVARLIDFRSIVAVPMMREGVPIGAIAVARTLSGRFPDRQIELLRTFADQAVIAIENVRLFQELQARTGELARSVEELTALGEVSRAVSSTLDLETVLNTIVARAVELSAADGGLIYEYDGTAQEFRFIKGSHRLDEELAEVIRRAPIRLGEGVAGTAAALREPVQVPDVLDEATYDVSRIRAVFGRRGYRSLLGVPLQFEQRIMGVLAVWRRKPGSFAPEVVRLLQTFAVQSVLAIHNAGLFREVQRQKQYADALVETSPVAIATMDLRGAVVGWNPGAVRLFGYTEAEAIGRNVDELVATPEIREQVRANVRQALGGERIRAIARRARKDGTLVDVEMSSMPLVVDGAEVGFIAIYHDITELLRARREAETANEAKSAFLATMSHEIRTPMNAVIGMSGLLLNTALTDEQREYAEIVRQSGDALLTVINDILDFSKIEAGKLELESQPFDVRDCVESALDLVATRAAEKGLDLAYLIGDGTPAAIVGDVTRLRQILLNLLSNAVKFTEQGEVVVSVSARGPEGAAAPHELTFSVRDTGIGIPPDRLGRLFRSFSQVDASTTRRYGGTGLGLAISQRLTELMGGEITVTSEVGRGSEFRFAIQARAARAPVPARRDLSGVQPSLRGRRVLVVDDNATNRRILASHLEAWGMAARATASPAEALEWIGAGERFDVGILDMHMPEMDGAALARAIRKRLSEATPPLVLFTSLGRREALAEGERFAAYLSKPIKPSQLFDALASVLADRPAHAPERTAAGSAFDPDMARRHPLRILLAEDNAVNQKLALRLLAQMGYRADVAANGLEVIDAVERQPYDVVLMDVQMPELDGLEASREINRRWPGERRPRLVAMTANAMEGDRELCEAAGMDDYVAKPIRVEELVAALERCGWRPEASARVGPAGVAGAGAPPGPRGAQEAAAIDWTVIEGLAATMGRAFVAELIDTFAQDARELIAALRRALAEADVDALRRAAHSLKSTSESLGATDLAALARALEAGVRAGRLDGAGEGIEQIADRYALVARALDARHRRLP